MESLFVLSFLPLVALGFVCLGISIGLATAKHYEWRRKVGLDKDDDKD